MIGAVAASILALRPKPLVELLVGAFAVLDALSLGGEQSFPDMQTA